MTIFFYLQMNYVMNFLNYFHPMMNQNFFEMKMMNYPMMMNFYVD
jgi:hypothetical protein